MTQQDQGIRMDAQIEINTPQAVVFEFWRRMENFPQFMTHVQEVRALQDNRYAWRVDGPAGTQMTWDADVTEVVGRERISWRSVEGAQVPNAGSVEFTPSASGGTNLHVKLFYSPPAGALGHAVASLFGKNPGQQMNDDLARCKQLLEAGVTQEGVMASQLETRPTIKPH